MESRLTRKINGNWDWNSLVGKPKAGIVCHTCGVITDVCFQRLDGHGECASCFGGNKEVAMTLKFRGVRE